MPSTDHVEAASLLAMQDADANKMEADTLALGRVDTHQLQLVSSAFGWQRGSATCRPDAVLHRALMQLYPCKSMQGLHVHGRCACVHQQAAGTVALRTAANQNNLIQLGRHARYVNLP